MADTNTLKSLEARKDVVKMKLRTLRSDIANPDRLKTAIASDRKEIERLTQRINRTNTRLKTMAQEHDECVEELSRLNKGVLLEKNEVKIRALKTLAETIKNADV